MTLHVPLTIQNPPTGLGAWRTFANPAAGSGWSATVPAGKAWRIWGGGCQLVASAVAATRLPGLLITNSGVLIYAYYNFQNGSATGVIANNTKQICYYAQGALLKPSYLSGPTAPLPIGCPTIWLPAGTVVQGVFDQIQAADQVTNVALLLEEVTP